MNRMIFAGLALVLLAGMAAAQSPNRPVNAKPKLKTVRLQIDGFQKSKSGAV